MTREDNIEMEEGQTTTDSSPEASQIVNKPKQKYKHMESIPSSLHILLRKLQFLAMAESGQKPLFSTMTFTSSGLIGALQRTYYGESRTSMLASVNQIFEETARTLNDSKHVDLIIEHVEGAKLGIQRIIETYASCPDVVSSLLITLKNIEILLSNNIKQ
jgi:hypothetical protein